VFRYLEKYPNNPAHKVEAILLAPQKSFLKKKESILPTEGKNVNWRSKKKKKRGGGKRQVGNQRKVGNSDTLQRKGYFWTKELRGSFGGSSM